MSTENLMEILEALDQKVEDLLLVNGELKSDRDRLLAELKEANQQKDDLTAQLAASSDKRSELRDRIQSIIQKIEQMES